MKDVYLLIEKETKIERQKHINLEEPCLERGGNSTNHKGVLAEFLNTTIPHGSKGAFLCHACNNGKCSNPKHLYWGTPKENVDDAIANGNFANYGRGGYKNPPMSEKTKLKISQTLKGRPSNNTKGINGTHTGKLIAGFRYNRKYKQIWINNGIDQTRIKFDSDIPEGYSRGRIK